MTKIAIFLMVLSTFSSLALGAFIAYSVDSNHEIFSVKGVNKASEREIEVTHEIKEAIMADNQLAMCAHNIKIITIKNAITLEGRVNSKADKLKVAYLARNMAGEKRVYNKLTY